MKVKFKMNVLLDGKKFNAGDVTDLSEKEVERLKQLVEVVEEETVEDKAVKPEEGLKQKAVKKSKKSKK